MSPSPYWPAGLYAVAYLGLGSVPPLVKASGRPVARAQTAQGAGPGRPSTGDLLISAAEGTGGLALGPGHTAYPQEAAQFLCANQS